MPVLPLPCLADTRRLCDVNKTSRCFFFQRCVLDGKKAIAVLWMFMSIVNTGTGYLNCTYKIETKDTFASFFPEFVMYDKGFIYGYFFFIVLCVVRPDVTKISSNKFIFLRNYDDVCCVLD